MEMHVSDLTILLQNLQHARERAQSPVERADLTSAIHMVTDKLITELNK